MFQVSGGAGSKTKRTAREPTMNAELLANATTVDLIAFARHMRFTRLNHGSDFMVRQLSRRIVQVETVIASRGVTF